MSSYDIDCINTAVEEYAVNVIIQLCDELRADGEDVTLLIEDDEWMSETFIQRGANETCYANLNFALFYGEEPSTRVILRLISIIFRFGEDYMDGNILTASNITIEYVLNVYAYIRFREHILNWREMLQEAVRAHLLENEN